MARAVLRFSVRTDARTSIDDTASRVGEALGCTFREGKVQGTPALTADLLGMQLALLGWQGIDRAKTFQLHGLVDYTSLLERYGDDVELTETDISQEVIDVLELRGAGQWRIPSRSEIEAEIDYGEELRRDFLTEGD